MDNKKLYPCVPYTKITKQAIELNAIKARYRLEHAQGYYSTYKAEKAYIKAMSALKRLYNNVVNNMVYATYVEKIYIENIVNEYRTKLFMDF